MREGRYKYEITKERLTRHAAELPENTPLPNRNELARQYGVARVTLERAISELIGEGVLVSRDGRGTYAAPKGSAPDAGQRVAAPDAGTWALLVYSVTKGISPGILRGVEDFTNRHGISLIVCNTDNDPQKEVEYLQKLCERNVGGIVLIPSTHSSPVKEVFGALEDKGVSIVACSRQVPGYDFPGTFQNFFQAGFLATQHLLQQGCRRVAYLATSRYSTIEDRLQGYMAALTQHNYQAPDDPAHEAFGLSNITGDIAELFAEFLRKHPQTDGVHIFNDRLAVPLYQVMKKLGIRAGRDIRVVAGEDSGFSSAFWVPLSTVDVPAYQLGASAAEQLYSLVQGQELDGNKHVVLSFALSARESSVGEG